MGMLFKSCEESCYVCDKGQYNEAPFWDKMKRRIHMFFCKSCKAYTAKNRKLSAILKSANIHHLCSEDKKQLEEKLLKEIKSHN